MPLLSIPDEMPVAVCPGGGLDFDLPTATPSHGKDDDDVHIRDNPA